MIKYDEIYKSQLILMSSASNITTLLMVKGAMAITTENNVFL